MFLFIAGMFFVLIILPIIDCATTILTNKTELLSCKIAKQIYQIQKEIHANDTEQQTTGPSIGFQTDCVGFTIPTIPEEYQDEEQEN